MSTTDPPISTTDPTDRVIEFTFQGALYALRPLEVTTALATECRQTTGLAPRFAFAAINRRDFDLDIAAVLLWLARRQAGHPPVTQIGRKSLSLWDEITATVTYDSLAEGFDVVETEQPVDPETSAGS